MSLAFFLDVIKLKSHYFKGIEFWVLLQRPTSYFSHLEVELVLYSQCLPKLGA